MLKIYYVDIMSHLNHNSKILYIIDTLNSLFGDFECSGLQAWLVDHWNWDQFLLNAPYTWPWAKLREASLATLI